jgi:hypothetical protein
MYTFLACDAVESKTSQEQRRRQSEEIERQRQAEIERRRRIEAEAVEAFQVRRVLHASRV